MRTAVLFTLAFLLLPVAAPAETPESQVRAVITAFQDALADRNITHLQKTVGNDVVSFENGSRREGWEQYRDHRLIPRFARPAPATHWQVVKISASADISWAYTKTVVSSPHKGDTVVWTVFVLERRGKEWKIVLVDSSSTRFLASPKRH